MQNFNLQKKIQFFRAGSVQVVITLKHSAVSEGKGDSECGTTQNLCAAHLLGLKGRVPDPSQVCLAQADRIRAFLSLQTSLAPVG